MTDALLPFIVLRADVRWGACVTELRRLVESGRDPKFYSARTKRAVNSLTVERGPKVVPHE